MQLKTVIDIEATPDAVWSILGDLPAYAEWNPFMPEAAGNLAVGERLDIRLQPVDGRAMRIRPRVRAVEPGRELRWLGRMGLPGLFDGEHRFTIENMTNLGALPTTGSWIVWGGPRNAEGSGAPSTVFGLVP